MAGIAALFTQSVTVETLTGSGAYGDVYAAPTVVECFINDRAKMVRNSQGDEVVSSTTLYAPLASSPDDPATAGQFSPGSRVTVNGRSALVLSVARRDGNGPSRIWHTEVTLT